MFGSEKIPGIKQEIEQLDEQINAHRLRARGLVKYAQSQMGLIDAHFAPLLANVKAKVEQFENGWPANACDGWNSVRWETWTPPVWNPDDGSSQELPALLRIGDLIEGRAGGGDFKVSAFMPFIGQNRTIIIHTKGDRHAAGLELLQALVIRTALMLPHQTVYALLDPAGNGAAFPMRRRLPQVHENSGDVRRDLDRVIQDIQRINENYLDASAPSFELVDAKQRINERFQFVFAADFPNKYDRRAIEALQSVANTGPRTGTYVFIHYNGDIEMPRDMSMSEFTNAAYLDLTERISLSALSFQPDRVPGAKLQEQLLERLKSAKPPERKVSWETVVPADAWWSESATEIIRTPIGISGASNILDLWFGVNQDGLACAHGMLGAMTGSGKSNLYHLLILGLCSRYSPNELRLFLIDGKDGVEFQPYRDLPHAEVVSLKSSPQLSRNVLAELVAERERRNRIFSDLRVTDFGQYRRAGQPKGNLPRILLLVDEYQELFEADRDGIASQLLLQLAQQGRSAGIHMLLGPQRFGAPGMLHQSAIFGNIHLRMAMQMTSSDVQALTEFGRRGKQMIARCDLPGKIVVNDHSGDDASNHEGKVAFLSGDERQQIINQLNQMAVETLASKDVPVTIVFDGKAQPNLIENPLVSYLLRQRSWLSDVDFENFARRPSHEEGVDVVDWYAAERPMIAWLGQDFTVRGQANVVIRRRTAENVMVIGGANAARYGMLSAMLVGLALNGGPGKMEFRLLDRSVPGTAWHSAMQSVVDTVLRPAGYSVTFSHDSHEMAEILDQLIVEIDIRRTRNEEDLVHEPSIFALFTDLDRVDDLRRRAETYGMSETPLGEKLSRVCIEGSALGIHLILSFSGVRPMSYVVDERRGLLNFRHRIALQVSEDESLTFVRNRKASQLQTEGAMPVCALYLDVENDRSLRFKPYSIESTIDFHEQLREIGQRVNEWSHKDEQQ